MILFICFLVFVCVHILVPWHCRIPLILFVATFRVFPDIRFVLMVGNLVMFEVYKLLARRWEALCGLREGFEQTVKNERSQSCI